MNDPVYKVFNLLFTPENIRSNAIQQHEWELSEFMRKVKYDLKPMRTVELGSYKGCSAICLSLVTSLKTISVDIENHGTEWAKHHASNLEFVVADATKEDVPAKVCEQLAGTIDLLFIDDGHYYEQIVKEFNIWKPWVSPGGWIAFHDINPLANIGPNGIQPPEIQVTRFWNELQGNKEEIIATEKHSRYRGVIPHGGIGILRL